MATDHKVNIFQFLMMGQKNKVCRSTPFNFYTVGERYLHACPLPDKVRKKAGTQLLSNQRYESHSSGVCY